MYGRLPFKEGMEMSWFRKERQAPLERTLDVSSVLRLSTIDLEIQLVPYANKETYDVEVIYYQYPDRSYRDRGTKHEVRVHAASWPEMRQKLDELLEPKP